MAAALLLAVPVACSVPPGARLESGGASTPAGVVQPQATPDVSGKPNADRTADPECYVVVEAVDMPPLTIDLLGRYAKHVVVAEVRSAGPGIFNTSDGKKPENATRPRGTRPAMVLTPVTVMVGDTFAGENASGAMQVTIEGGTADCIVHHVDRAPELTQGSRYVLFLIPGRDYDGTARPERPLVLAAWPVEDDGTVQTAEDGTLPLDALADKIAAWPPD